MTIQNLLLSETEYPGGPAPVQRNEAQQHTEQMAELGQALLDSIRAHAYPGWNPAQCPSEIVGDLRAECDELRRDAYRYRFLRDEDNWGEDSGDDCWANLGEVSGDLFDEIIDSRMTKNGG